MTEKERIQEKISALIRRKGVADSKATYYLTLANEYEEKICGLRAKLKDLEVSK